MIEVFVLFLFDFGVRFFEDLSDVAFNFLRDFTDQMPVLVILRLGENNRFAGD